VEAQWEMEKLKADKEECHTHRKNQKAKQDVWIATDSSGQGQTLRYIFFYYYVFIINLIS
jgi:hypothetical protein